MGLLRKYFLPNAYVSSIHNLDWNLLAQSGVKGVITDLDNTLVGWDESEPTEEVRNWFRKLNELNITVTIVSNNNEARVARFCESLDVDYIFQAQKPRGKSFQKAIDQMKISSNDIVVIGDQMLTDVFGGNRRDLYTIMVVPVKQTDGLITKFNRMIERRLLNYFKRKGYIKWEE
ncbi:YqeG family HAD IIIA-type phosphatase [Staphylococcus sp. SQ8-PEA]|uniref:YqeG family HAD IIIA-type phosphatase n=1 Tax=Staphylococcus marylandisciuri TaxID=2981529 RepID=A0ABT2QR06_9STAP|nr:YqeG family HAD IIIA-type phosphatase [Staphylococcus marylandisciuri]MCU5746415.1 YqeG family HAD IIIA-type phosphatase [Staphylococcus marylandisciuri]